MSAATVVLVHGAWHGGWCWDRVAHGLVGAGHDVRTLDLPSTGSGDTADLTDDVAAVRGLLDDVGAEGREVVLVGHSYGGAVVTDSGVHPAVRHVVYLAAFAIDETESCGAAAGAEAESEGITHEGRFVPGFETVDGSFIPTADTATALLFNDCDAETAAWATSMLRPQPLITLAQSPAHVAWREKSTSYVVCTEDNAVHPDLQRILARRCATSLEWPTGHSPFLSRPALVVDLVASLAT